LNQSEYIQIIDDCILILFQLILHNNALYSSLLSSHTTHYTLDTRHRLSYYHLRVRQSINLSERWLLSILSQQ
jgi:hypothetical protein